MENEDDIPFRLGSVLRKFEGSIFHLDVYTRIRPTKIHREELDEYQRKAIFDAEDVTTGEFVIFMLYVQPDPFASVGCLGEDLSSKARRFISLFYQECKTFQEGSRTGYTPDYLAPHAAMKQDNRYEYPGGHLSVLVLSKIPATVKKVRDLKQVELPAFAKGCEEMFRTFRGRGLRLGMNKWYLKYDPETAKPYVFEPWFSEDPASQPPSPELYEMLDIEEIVMYYFGEEARRELFGEPSVLGPPTGFLKELKRKASDLGLAKSPDLNGDTSPAETRTNDDDQACGIAGLCTACI